MVCMITGQPSRLTDPAVLMEMLAIVRSWLLSPPPSGGAPRPAAPELQTPALHRREPSLSCRQQTVSRLTNHQRWKSDTVFLAGLSEKESALFMERLAALERSGATEGPIKGAWEDAFLDLTHRLITQPGTEVACLFDREDLTDLLFNAVHGLGCTVGCSTIHMPAHSVCAAVD